MELNQQPDALATGSPEETAPPPADRISTGMLWLDVVLGGGIPKTRVYLIIGEPGTGKTTLGLQFLLEGVRQNESTLFITLAETRDELAAVARSHGMDLSKIVIHQVLSSEEQKTDEDYTALHPAEVELGESMAHIIAAIDRVQPKRVVIDSLTELRLLAREPVRYRRQVIALKNHLVKCGCTVYFIDNPSRLAGGDGQLQTICHGVIALERMAPEYGRERRRLQVLKMRGVQFAGGYHDYVVRKGGLTVWPRLTAVEHRRDYQMEPVSSGVPEVDQILGGGPDRGTTMLVVGAAGTGKSSLCQQYCMAAAKRGEYFAWFSFDERLDTVFKRARSMGVDFEQLRSEGRCSVEQVDPGSLSPGEFIQRVRRQVEKFGARIVVVDSVNGYLNAMPGEQFLIIQMYELLTYLSRMGVLSMIIVAQHGLLGRHMDPPVDLSYLADTVTLLRYFEYAGEVRRAVSVVKKRGAPHEATIRELQVTAEGVVVGEPLRHFHGVLSGEPHYVGDGPPLMHGRDAVTSNGSGGGGGDDGQSVVR